MKRTLAQRDRRGVERASEQASKREEKELTYLIQINHNAAANSISRFVFARAPHRDADQPEPTARREHQSRPILPTKCFEKHTILKLQFLKCDFSSQIGRNWSTAKALFFYCKR